MLSKFDRNQYFSQYVNGVFTFDPLLNQIEPGLLGAASNTYVVVEGDLRGLHEGVAQHDHARAPARRPRRRPFPVDEALRVDVHPDLAELRAYGVIARHDEFGVDPQFRQHGVHIPQGQRIAVLQGSAQTVQDQLVKATIKVTSAIK